MRHLRSWNLERTRRVKLHQLRRGQSIRGDRRNVSRDLHYVRRRNLVCSGRSNLHQLCWRNIFTSDRCRLRGNVQQLRRGNLRSSGVCIMLDVRRGNVVRSSGHSLHPMRRWHAVGRNWTNVFCDVHELRHQFLLERRRSKLERKPMTQQ